MRLVRRVMFVVGVALLAPWAMRPAWSDDVPQPLPSLDGPLYMIVSAPGDDFSIDFGGGGGEFPVPGSGSETILLRMGTLTGGGAVLQTRFFSAPIPRFVVPEGTTLPQLAGNQIAIVGGFRAGDGVTHLVTLVRDDPANSEDGIPAGAQEAVLYAMQHGALDTLESNPHPTTWEIVNALVVGQPDGSFIPPQAIYSYLFSAPNRATSRGPNVVACEGELFPHEPSDEPIFDFDASMAENDDGEVETEADVCRVVGVDAKPGDSANHVNYTKKKGALKVAILSSEFFDAAEVVAATGQIGGVFAVSGKLQDVDHDGRKDMVLKFKMKDLIEAGAVGADTTSLDVMADLEDGSCVTGSAAVAAGSDGAGEDD